MKKLLLTTIFAAAFVAPAAAGQADSFIKAAAMTLTYAERCPNDMKLSQNTIKFFSVIEENIPDGVASARSQLVSKISSGSGGWGTWCNAVAEQVPAIDIVAMKAMTVLTKELQKGLGQ